MTATELLQQGINLMLVGMGFVLLFLLILIYAIGLMSKFINRFLPEPIPRSKNIKPTSKTDNDIDRLRPVIVAAVHHYRRQQGQK